MTFWFVFCLVGHAVFFQCSWNLNSTELGYTLLKTWCPVSLSEAWKYIGCSYDGKGGGGGGGTKWGIRRSSAHLHPANASSRKTLMTLSPSISPCLSSLWEGLVFFRGSSSLLKWISFSFLLMRGRGTEPTIRRMEWRKTEFLPWFSKDVLFRVI